MTLAAVKTRDSLLLLGDEPGAARANEIYQQASALLAALGQRLAALRDSQDPEVAGFVRLLIDRLHAPGPVPHGVPAEDR